MKNRDMTALLFLLLSVTESKWFKRCELAKIMKSVSLDTYGGQSIGDWVCLAYYESRFNSRAVGLTTPEGGRNFGIFQVNSFWWCSRGRAKPDFGCQVYCSDLTDDDITDDILCAKIIAGTRTGMKAWLNWTSHCKGKDNSRWVRNCRL